MDSSKVASGTIIVVITTVNGLTCVAAPFPSLDVVGGFPPVDTTARDNVTTTHSALAVTITVVSAAFHD
jgi:hypothetical protein